MPNLHEKVCLQSDRCATEQILFCQNISNKRTIEDTKNEKQKIVHNRFSYELNRPDRFLKSRLECVVISALNPYYFTIQLREDAVEFDRFQRNINDFYNKTNDQRYVVKPEQIRVNLCVICSDAKSTNTEKIWTRSQILDFDPTDNTVNLFYVDFGTWEEYVPIHRLRHITDYFHRHLVFSITCRLANIQPLNNGDDELAWTDDATEQFLAVVGQLPSEIELLSYSSNRCVQANLFVINAEQHVCVNEYMVHIKKAKLIHHTTGMNDGSHNNNQVRNNLIYLVHYL